MSGGVLPAIITPFFGKVSFYKIAKFLKSVL